MTTFLLFALIILDFALIGAVFLLQRRQTIHSDLIADLTEERRLISEMRSAVQEELESGHARIRESIDKVSRIAAEAEHEVRSGGETLTKEVDGIISQLASKFEDPLRELTKKQQYVESLLKRVDSEKKLLHKVIIRGEKICQFFDQRVPYEEVLNEIEDKKYVDARYMLSKGVEPSQIARDLGMSESEVRLVAGLSAALMTP